MTNLYNDVYCMQHFIIAYVYCILRVYSIRRHTDRLGRLRSTGVSGSQNTWRTTYLYITCVVFGFVYFCPSVSQCTLRKINKSSLILFIHKI